MKKVVSLVGARPQFIKEAVIGAEVRRRNAWNHILVHSGQHYDVNMPDTGWRELVETGWNLLCTPDAEQIVHRITTALEATRRPDNLFGDGRAGNHIVNIITGISS